MSFRRTLLRPRIFRSITNPLPSNAVLFLGHRAVNFSMAVYPSELSQKKVNYADKIKSLKLPDIHKYYSLLVQELRDNNETPEVSSRILHPLNASDLTSIMHLLASSGRPEDLQRIEGILSDMPELFGIKPSTHTHTDIIRGLIKTGNPALVRQWIFNMPSLPSPVKPIHNHFHMLLKACSDTATFSFLRDVVFSMRKTGCPPNNETFGLLILARWKKAADEDQLPPVSEFSAIIADMKREGLHYDPNIATLLHGKYVESGSTESADEIRAVYETTVPYARQLDNQQIYIWFAKLRSVSSQRGVREAIKTLKILETQGCPRSSVAIKYILRESRRLEDIHIVEQELSIPCNVVHWSLLIANNVRAGYLYEALSIYEESKKAGIVPDAGLVAPIIRELSRNSSNSKLVTPIDQAMSLYHDLVKTSPSRERTKSTLIQHSSGPDLGIYQALLRGIALSNNVNKYYPVAMSLLKDMKSRGLLITDSITTTSRIVLSMRNSPSTSKALEHYRELRSYLDPKGYSVVLSAFSKLSFGDEMHIPSLVDYFEIVNDMRRSGFTMTIEVYTILLHQIGFLASRMSKRDSDVPPGLRENLITTTRHAHDLLTLDASLSPDAHVWNQLMDTYQRLNCFPDAYRVWDMMYLTGRFDNISVSIIIDACGFAGAWHVAKQIFTKLSRDKFTFDINTWNTWLECLCRLGRLNDALKVVCLEMGHGENIQRPNIESVRILLKFARKQNHLGEVVSRLEQHHPELVRRLSEEIRRL